MFRLLHLSDIHIGDTYKEPGEIAYKIASDLVQHGFGRIQCVVVTGDIFEGTVAYSEELISQATDFFEVLLKEINYNQEDSPIDKEDILFVPGNHDILRIKEKSKRWEKYHAFLIKFYGKIPAFYYEDDFSFFKKYNAQRIAFVGLNSCQIEQKRTMDDTYISKLEKTVGEEVFEKRGIKRSVIIDILKSQTANEYDDYGHIPLSQVTRIGREVKKLDNYNIIALFHHHFYLFPEIAQKMGDSSLLRNHAEIVQQLKYMNVRIVLHGHKHFSLERPFITEDYYASPEDTIDVFAGGSVGTKRTSTHTFSVLDLYGKEADTKFIHNKFVYRDERLEPIIRKQVPPHRAGGQIIKLLEILDTQNPSLYIAYRNMADRAYKSYESCNKIIGWVSEALTGFADTYRYLEDGGNSILFLLYAINLRAVSYMELIEGKTSDLESVKRLWNDFYDEYLLQTKFSIEKGDYHRLFQYKKLQHSAEECDKLLKRCNDKISQIYLAFTMLGVFFTDLYLVLTHYADAFKVQIENKVNIKIDENKFHENVPAPRIVIKSDADRRSAYVELFCSDATAHKIAVLFVKEFDLLISKFEDYFKLIGLKLYYLLPRIDKDLMKNTVDNYNFEAYIPTLLPLLTGDNIYTSKLVFARELIQNSIDAIAVRSAKDSLPFPKDIQIELGTDNRGKRYFRITDHGTGMDRYKIERYFTSIGRSFYSGKEYEELMIDYKPISNFGIGFLSSFMVCQEIDVKTKFYEADSEGLFLHIPNYDGCFFIERAPDIPVGTEITLYLTCECTNEEIEEYIRNVMSDVGYNISIKLLPHDGKQKSYSVHAHSIRKNVDNELKLFVPFREDGTVGQADYRQDILSGAYIDSYPCGLLVQKSADSDYGNHWHILNAGIRIKYVHPKILFEDRKNKPWTNDFEFLNDAGMDIISNFPANWLQLDVSRDNVSGFTPIVQKDLCDAIAEQLYQQICQFIQYAEQYPVKTLCADLQTSINQTMHLKGIPENLYQKLEYLKYILKIEYCKRSIRFSLVRRKEQNDSIFGEPVQIRQERTNGEYAAYIKHLKFINIKHLLFNRENILSMEEHRILDDQIFHSKRVSAKYLLGYLGRSDQDVRARKIYALASIILSQPFVQTREDFSESGKYCIQLLKSALLLRAHVGREKDKGSAITISYQEVLKLFSSVE